MPSSSSWLSARSDVLDRVSITCSAALHDNLLLDAADRQRRVHGRRERGAERDPFPAHGLESDQLERHRVLARAQIDDLIPPFRGGDGGSHALDQRGTGNLHGDTGQCGPGVIRDGPDDGRGGLGGRATREPQRQRERGDDDAKLPHDRAPRIDVQKKRPLESGPYVETAARNASGRG